MSQIDKIGFPDDMIPKEDKGHNWLLQYSKAVHYANRDSPRTIFFNNMGNYLEWKDYAMASQTIDKYKPSLGIDEQNNETYMNVDFKILAVLPKFLRIALEALDKIGYNMKVRSVDPLAETEKSKWYAKQMAKISLREQLKQVDPYILQKLPALKNKAGEPEDDQELEIMNKYTYSDNRAKKFKKVMNLIAQQNDINKIREEIKTSLLYFGVSGIKDYIDSNGAIKFRSVDISNVIMSPCIKNDFSDARYIGEYQSMTLSELRQLAGDQFTEGEYRQIATKVGNNSNYMDNNIYYPNNFNYDKYRVRVLDLEIKTVNSSYRQERTDRRGNKIYVNVKGSVKESDLMPNKNDNYTRKYIRKDYEVLYKVKWIVDTDLIFEYGLQTDMKRQKKSLQNVISSYHFFAPTYNNYIPQSRIKDAMPIVDAIQLSWFKFQNELNRVVPNGWTINMDAIENIPLGKGGDSMKPEDILNMFFQTGVLVYRGSDMRGTPHTNPQPIERLINGIGADVMNYYKVLDMEVQKLREILGVSEIQDGTGSADRTNKEGLKMEFEASNNSLADVIRGERHLLKELYQSLKIRAQDVLKVRTIEGYLTDLGKGTVEFIQADNKLSDGEFTLEIEDKPNDADKLRLESIINDAYSKQELDARDLFIIENMEDINEAQALLGYKIQKYKNKLKEEAMMKMQLSIQEKQQLTDIDTKASMAKEQQSWQLKTQYLTVEKQADKQLQDEKYKYELQIKGIQAQAGIEEKLIITRSKEKISDSKSMSLLNKVRNSKQLVTA